MKLTEKQKRFIDYINRKKYKKSIADWKEIVERLIYLYLIAENDSDKECVAWLISRLKVKILNLEKILDIKELYRYAKKKEAKIQKQRKFAQKRRHQKRQDFALTEEEWLAALEYFDYKCAYCGREEGLTYDHFIPFSKGGSFTKENIIPACKFCNSSKNNSDFEKWYKSYKYFEPTRYDRIKKYLKLVSQDG